MLPETHKCHNHFNFLRSNVCGYKLISVLSQNKDSPKDHQMRFAVNIYATISSCINYLLHVGWRAQVHQTLR